MQEYLAMLEEAKKYDHRELTKKQELFFFHPLRLEDSCLVQIDKQEFGLKPMNCPGHCLIFDHRVRSYRNCHLG
nr:threonine--tRNA ligase, mitochondrial 1-like [Ipomoea batatas]